MTDESHKAAIKRVLVYIDRHKDENLDLDTLSKVARISKFHFHRLFRGYMGVSLGQYIKLARIEKSMHGLTFGNHSILDIALSAGYETHASFVKAFRKELGCTPSEFRKNFEEEKGKFMSMLKNKKPEFLGVKELKPIKTSYVRETGSYFESPRRAWSKVQNRLAEIKFPTSEAEFYGMSHDNPHAEGIEEKDLRFDACLAFPTQPEALSQLGFTAGEIAGGNYAVFLHVGPYETLGDSFHYIYGHWVYEQDRKLRNVPAFIKMLDLFQNKPESEIRSAIHIPIK
jgi:AraC family transcriptional regulator